MNRKFFENKLKIDEQCEIFLKQNYPSFLEYYAMLKD